jgi:hypothetical protein
MRYNKPGTPYYKAAQRIKLNSATVLAELDSLRTSAPSELVSDKGMGYLQCNTPTIGDLEPPLALLDLLVSLDIADELSIVLHYNPLQFLLAYELPEAKPLPVAPIQPGLPHRKKKRERKAEFGKRRTEQRAALAAQALVAAEADSEMGDASFDSHTLPAASHPAKLAASVDMDPMGKTIAMAIASSELGYGSEAEQTLGKRKRAKRARSHPGTDAEVLTDINPKASFALFDKGWILDPGVRRGGRTRTERLPPPPTKKRSKGTGIFRNLIHELTWRIRTNFSRQGRYAGN